MAESRAHLILVEKLVEWLGLNVPNRESLLILRESPDTTSASRPPAIGGFYPDVFCRAHDRTHIWLGEAKTADDIENRHSRDQFKSFLIYLKGHGPGTLVIATPWHAMARALSLTRLLQRETNTMEVDTVFLKCLPG